MEINRELKKLKQDTISYSYTIHPENQNSIIDNKRNAQKSSTWHFQSMLRLQNLFHKSYKEKQKKKKRKESKIHNHTKLN